MTSDSAKRKRRDSNKNDMIIESNDNKHTTQQHKKKQASGDKVPKFKPLTVQQIQTSNNASVYTRISVPPHRLTPLKSQWMEIYKPIVEYMKLQIRYNVKKRCIELRVPNTLPQRIPNTASSTAVESTADPSQLPISVTPDAQSSLTRAADFIRAFMLGFNVSDAIALLRLDELYIDTFEIKDVKILQNEHLSRAIGRIAGIQGKTKYTIENSTKTRIVLADTHIHILGSYSNINTAKQAIVRLIMGSPPSKVYTQMRAVAAKQKQRF